MEPKQLSKLTAELQSKYPNAGVQSIEINEKAGTSTLFMRPNEKVLAFLEKGAVIPKIRNSTSAAVITRDAIDRTILDLAKKDPYTDEPKTSYERAIRYYYTDPLLGSVVNFLANVSSKGFEHDIDDANIKNFFDVWAFDVGLHQLLEWIFLDFFKVGMVATYKVISKYEPRVSYLSPVPGQKMKKASKETAAKKKTWSKGYIPVAYTVLNPQLVTIEGNLLFNNTRISLTAPKELQDLLKKKGGDLTEEEKMLIKSLPSDFKAAAEKGQSFPLDPTIANLITYRKQPYERYSRPRSLRIFDSLDYKKSLKEADLSTLDGITNYILKVTIGNDEYPVTSQEELNAVAQLFNTPSKSFDVVWNHTLEIEKIISPEIGDILGIKKYEQVNSDLTAGLSIARAFIDGTGENMSVSSAQLVVKGVQEEVDYARRQVTNWIYKEYQQIAEAVGFDRFPKIRWDESVLKDTIMYMNIISQLVDRRMISYNSALELLGFDYNNELNNMQTELKLVEDGVFGIIGSPWQKAKQPVQGSPVGTPSAGRPKGKDPNTKKTPQTNPAKKNTTQKQTKTKPQAQQVVKSSLKLSDMIKDMNDEEYAAFMEEVEILRNQNEEGETDGET
jgi:hypothetical protein